MKNELKKCPECGLETIEKIVGEVVLKRGSIPHVPHEKCSHCESIFLSADSYEVIEKYEEETAA